MLANQIRPTTLSVAIVFRVHPFLARKAPGTPVFGHCPNKYSEKATTVAIGMPALHAADYSLRYAGSHYCIKVRCTTTTVLIFFMLRYRLHTAVCIEQNHTRSAHDQSSKHTAVVSYMCATHVLHGRQQ